MSIFINEKNIILTQLYKEDQQLYHNYAQSCGMSSTTLTLLCAVCENSEPISQAYICQDWSISKQTLNSSIKQLVSEGYVTLKNCENNKKVKNIILTEKGEEMVKEKIYKLLEIENNALLQLSEQEQEILITLSQKRNLALKNLIDKEIKQKENK